MVYCNVDGSRSLLWMKFVMIRKYKTTSTYHVLLILSFCYTNKIHDLRLCIHSITICKSNIHYMYNLLFRQSKMSAERIKLCRVGHVTAYYNPRISADDISILKCKTMKKWQRYSFPKLEVHVWKYDGFEGHRHCRLQLT